MQQIHCLTIAVTTHHNMSNVVHNTTELQTSWFTAVKFILEIFSVRNQIPSITDYEHIANMCFGETGGQHSTVHAGEENGFWLKI
jgi:dTDP-4-dehydrorhamnose reductase